MATRLKNIIRFSGLVIGVPVVLPHNLSLSGVALIPDQVDPSIGEFTVVADATNVTVTRTGSASAVDVLVEYWYSADRVFGSAGSPFTQLAPVPFVTNPGAPASLNPSRVVVVAKSGGDTTSIVAGVALALALVPAPSMTDPALVLVYPGVYSELPITMSAFVTLTSIGGASATLIDATTTTAALLNVVVNSEVSGFTLEGASGVGGVGVQNASGGLATVRDMVVIDCETGALATGAGSILLMFLFEAVHTVLTAMVTGIRADAGATVEGQDITILSELGGMPEGIVADGAAALIELQAVNIQDCVDGLIARNTGVAEVVDGIIRECTNAIRIEATSGIIRIDSVRCELSTSLDLLIESATGLLTGVGNTIRNDRLSIAAGATVLSLHASEVPGALQITVFGEFSVGSEFLPSESAFGGGDSHVRNMSVLRNTNLEVGTFSDITTAMASETGSTADVFPGVGAGNTMFIGGDVAFPGNRIITTAAIALGAGSLIWEFSTGAGWTAMNVMASHAHAPYDQFAQDVFGRIETEQLRFGPMTGWATQAVNGVTKFWVRVRVAVGITTVPTLEQIKLGTNHTEINADGTVELFGTAMNDHELVWHQRIMDDLTGSSPSNGALALSTNVNITPVDNRYNNNAIDGLGGLFEIPAGLDTSQPLVLEINWIPKATGGNVELESDFAELPIGSVLDGTTSDTNVSVIIAAPAIDTLVHSELELAVEELVPGDLLAFSMFRDATGGNADDTLVGSIDIVTVALHGKLWR